MALARLTGGPLDGQVIPLDADADESLIVAYGEGQLIYQRAGDLVHTGEGDGPTEARYVFSQSTEDINPDDDGRDD